MIGIQALNRISKTQIAAAGPRYTPSLEPHAPNLGVKPVIDALEALAFSSQSTAPLSALATRIQQLWSTAPRQIQAAFRRRKQTPLYLATLLGELADSTPETASRTAIKLPRATEYVLRRLNSLRRSLYASEIELDKNKDEEGLQRTRSIIRGLQEIRDPIEELDGLIHRPSFHLLYSSKALLLGSWGTGKTHSLCDFTKTCIGRRIPALFFLAENLQGGSDPLIGLCKASGIADSQAELLAGLEAPCHEIQDESFNHHRCG